MPVRKESRHRVLQRFSDWQLIGWYVCISAVVRGIPWVVRGKRWRGNVVAAAPDFDLRLAVPGGNFSLVQALQRAVVPLVQPPGTVYRYPHHVELVESNPERADGAFQHRGVGDIEFILLGRHQTPGLAGLNAPYIAEIDVGPPREPVFPVPDTFTVTKQDEPVHGCL